jgi:hypothetical protein
MAVWRGPFILRSDPPQPYPIRYRIGAPYSGKTHPNLIMPKWPSSDGKRQITVEVPAEHVEHLDAQAAYRGMTRAAYVRGLIVRDIVRQGPGRMAKTTGAALD